jgi:hypothetical protein
VTIDRLPRLRPDGNADRRNLYEPESTRELGFELMGMGRAAASPGIGVHSSAARLVRFRAGSGRPPACQQRR